MGKIEFIEYLAKTHEISKKEAREMLETVLDGIISAMQEGNDINLIGFGKFTVQLVEEAERKNPQNGETITVAAHKVPKFKFSSNVKSVIR